MGKVRIQSGQYLNRAIAFNDEQGIRPSSARVRKTLFDWIRFDIKGKDCLDVCSGSGVLAFEAASNGCASVLCLDNNSQTCQHIQAEARRLDVKSIKVRCETVPCELDQSFHVCFLDVPFNDKQLLEDCTSWLSRDNILLPGGLLYIESQEPYHQIANMKLLKHKKVASVYMQLFESSNE